VAALMGETDGTNPGDEAPPGTPGTGENLCRDCNGTGELEGKSCPNCGGTGKVIEGIGGA
jgi:DnaJ-class molecular chaperone